MFVEGRHASFIMLTGGLMGTAAGRIVIISALLGAFAAMSGCERVDENAAGEVVIEVAWFEGGFGIDWHKDIARAYSEMHAADGIRVNLWGDPRVGDKIRPRIIRRDPPNIANAGPLVWTLILADKLYPLNDVLDTPSYDDPGVTWKDTFVDGSLDLYRHEGNYYAVPFMLGIYTLWYDRKLFRDKEWRIPETWDELMALSEQIKSDPGLYDPSTKQWNRIAPFAFQGKYAGYAFGIIHTLYQRIAGYPGVIVLSNFRTETFESPEFIEAARLMQDYASKYFQDGCWGMSHTEGQMEFCNRRTAFVACGQWLANEMQDAWPADFELACFPVPAVEGGKGDPTAVQGTASGEAVVIFKEASHSREAAEFLKFMSSVENGASYIRECGTLPSLRHRYPPEIYPPHLRGVSDLITGAKYIFEVRVDGFALHWQSTVMPLETEKLLRGKITTEEYGRNLKRGLDSELSRKDFYRPPDVEPNPDLMDF